MKNEINSGVKKVLKELVSSKIELLQARESILGIKDENTSLISQLYDELITPKESYSIVRGDKIRDDSGYTGKRNIQKISLILKLLPQLKKFFVFNKIGYDALRTAAFFLELRKIPKDTYIFQQGQVSDVFYGIIQGRISIRSQKKVKHARRRTAYDIISAGEDYQIETVEEELNVLTSGSYFGEIGIMERKERTAAAYTLEDSDLFCLDAKAFESSFGKYIIKAENERKNFLVNLIKPISLLPRTKFNQIYRNFIRAHFVTRNDVIYTEGTLANKLYIIYEGQFRLKKKNLCEKKDNDENYYQSDIARHPVVLNLTDGDFAGLEAFLNYDFSYITRDSTSNAINSTAPSNANEKTQTKQGHFQLLTDVQPSEKIKYKNSLITESEFSVVFSLDPNVLGNELRNDLFEFLKPIFEKREKFISEIFKNHQVIKENMKLAYREKLITDISKNNNKHLLDKIDRIGENDNYLAIIKPLQLEKIKKQNELNFQIKFSKINNDRTNNTANTTKYSASSEDILPRRNFNPKSGNTVVNSLSGNSLLTKVVSIRCPSKTPSTLERTKKFVFEINTTDKSTFITDKSSKNGSDTIKSQKHYRIERRPEIFNRDEKKKLSTIDKSIKSIDRLKLKIISSHNDKGDLSKYVHKYVATTLNGWSKLNKNCARDYSSGDFNLPLVTKISTRKKTE